jgi:predicted transcriptional regulator
MRIVTLVVLACVCAFTGCTSSRVIENTRVPEIEIDEFGAITFDGDPVKLGKVASAVRAAGIGREQEINIRVPEKFDATLRNEICAELVRRGYTRTIFIKARKATATVTPKR